jgi:hypothetical protein
VLDRSVLTDLPVRRPVAAALYAGALVLGFGGGALVGVAGGSTPSAGASPAASATLRPLTATATCQSDDGREADGSTVSYGPEHVLDEDPATAWRCTGDGRGERLTIELGGAATIEEVAIVPGYAKTDPADSTDRYAQNRRLTKVRWVFDGGVALEQTLDPSPGSRELQRVAVPAVRSGTVVLEVLESSDGERNSVAVGSVVLSGQAGAAAQEAVGQ